MEEMRGALAVWFLLLHRLASAGVYADGSLSNLGDLLNRFGPKNVKFREPEEVAPVNLIDGFRSTPRPPYADALAKVYARVCNRARASGVMSQETLKNEEQTITKDIEQELRSDPDMAEIFASVQLEQLKEQRKKLQERNVAILKECVPKLCVSESSTSGPESQPLDSSRGVSPLEACSSLESSSSSSETPNSSQTGHSQILREAPTTQAHLEHLRTQVQRKYQKDILFPTVQLSTNASLLPRVHELLRTLQGRDLRNLERLHKVFAGAAEMLVEDVRAGAELQRWVIFGDVFGDQDDRPPETVVNAIATLKRYEVYRIHQIFWQT